MRRPLTPLRWFLLIYTVLFLQAFLGHWIPSGVVRPEFDLLILGLFAMEHPWVWATLLGFWNGLLRDSLTHGPSGCWTFALVLFAWALARWGKRRRLGSLKKTLLLSGAIAAVGGLVFFREKGMGESNLYLRFLVSSLLPTSGVTGIFCFLWIRFFERWFSDLHLTPLGS